MDEYGAKQLSARLLGSTLGGWHILEYVNHGKSAVVFRARKGDIEAALKVFDPEIVNRFGRPAQLKRVEREKSLIGRSHPNLVQIYDGGAEDDFLFVAMEYFAGRNLAQALVDIPAANAGAIIAQVASAARFLEEVSFAHRDIKPENIGVAPDLKSIKLLDLGVIRPLDLTSVTDEGDQRFFVGTLQYSPPELLFREEEQSVEAWRAITFYQLGGVLHDLLMKKPLFHEFVHPYARLVRAVEREVPQINALGADPGLRLLAQNCLMKAPRRRLETVRWEDFARPPVRDPLESARRRIAQRRTAATQVTELAESTYDQERTLAFTLETSIHSAVVNTIATESLPRYSMQRMNERNPFILRIVFEPSLRVGLRSYFAVYCVGRIIDAAAGLQQLDVYACTTRAREDIPAEPTEANPTNSVKGALIDQDIRAHIERCLLLAYAGALDGSPQDSVVRWMTLGEEV